MNDLLKTPTLSTTERFKRLCAACLDGRLAGAELELHEWSRQADCPPQASVLLAACMARRNAFDDAATILRDSNTAVGSMTLICVYTLLQMPQAAAQQVRNLHDQWGHHWPVAHWLNVMQMAQASPSDAVVKELAEELKANTQIIPSLVAAQKISPVSEHIQALRQAIELSIRQRTLDEEQQVQICHAMADLAMLAKDHSDARRWAHRGLAINPLYAHLAIILSQFEDNTQLGPLAITVLARNERAHQGYQDVRAALIRREHQHGMKDAARLRISHWLADDPANPMAKKLQQELAA